jgi:diguanylate cyclase (GGDEF)-like protein
VLAAVASIVVALVIVALAAAVRRLLANLRLTERHSQHLDQQLERLSEAVARLEAEKSLLSGFLGVLPALAHELRYAATDRQITATLLDTLVSTIEPRAAVVLMRRRQLVPEAQGRTRFAVAATVPPDSAAHVGLEVVLAADGHDPATYDGECVQRAGLPLPAPLLTAPLILETEVVGLIALTPSELNRDVPLVLQAVADVGALALHEAATRRRIRTTAQVDELTRVFNKSHIAHTLSETVARAEREQRPLSILLFDIDLFKRYNDVNGHLAGDILLRLLAQLVHDNVRATDVVGRFGGEEFLVVLPETTLAEACHVAEKLRTLIAEQEFPARESQPQGRVTISGGVAELAGHSGSASVLLRAADEALYTAKREGRNRIVLARVDSASLTGGDVVLEEEWDS